MTDTDSDQALAFGALPLVDALQDNLRQMGFSHCTPIQAKTLPLALEGRDIAGQAQTGTGKTIAFLLATLDHLIRSEPSGPDGQPRAVILAPTRELVIQIHKDAEPLAHNTGIRLGLVYGGTGYEAQREQIAQGVDVLIGTPGRLIDYFKQKVFTLKHAQVAVLDEADRMFDLGFISDIRYILRHCKPADQRRNYLFSATLSHRVLELAYEHMNNPTRVEIEPEQVTADRVRQSLVHVANDEKLPMLVGVLRHTGATRTMIFVNTKRAADVVERTLRGNDIEARTLSGDVPQKKREQLLERFRSGTLGVLVATDVAARGLHIDGVTHVINYDLPQDAQDYVHRIGRTARAGAEGDAISLCCEEWVYSLPEIEAYTGMKIPNLPDAGNWMATDLKAALPKPPRAATKKGSGGNRQRRGGGGRSRDRHGSRGSPKT
ncbi:DEAD/DEAH box helicase [Algiphilus sp.]|uniref:DEAD/DEAH box helicase n=1 Tax=Algiphilus sp. TaxID=1872431 RepID=UPI0032EB4C30